jgi:SAM-dependent methyltransferase/pyruvate-formate lyase-activating enzyme
MKALIKVGYGCNENCSFCHTLDVRHLQGDTSEVHAKIARAKALGHTMVVLSGGEPTIRPELIAWADHVVSLDMDFGLVTNGLLLAYPELVDKLLSRRLRYVYMSLHGGSAEVNDRMVRADAFGAAMKAIANLAGRVPDFSINCVVTRQNLDHLRGLVDALLPYPDLTLKFSMVQPKGGGARAFDILTPRVSDVAARVVDAIAYGRTRTNGQGPRFAHDGIPLCLLPGLESDYDDLKTHRFATMVEIGEPDFFPVDDRAKIQPEPCRGCALSGPCPGLYRGYHEQFGDKELRPVAGGARSNSFNWVYEALVPSQPERCPILDDGTTPWDRGRHLFVRHNGKVARYRAGTRDFSDVAVEQIKHALGQVYLDASKKPAPDDFARDLVPLRRSALCTPCPEQARCTGLWEPRFDDLFTRDDARVRAHLAELEGDVLDVGCGEAPYAGVLAPRIAAGRVRYVGLDPDAARLEALRPRLPGAELHAGDAIAWAASTARRFDHILVLRSWNHLPDPAAALAALSALLRPGGSLLIVDNVAYGLARTVAHARRAEGGPSLREHFRNDDAGDAHRLAGALGLTLVDRRDVAPDTSNQWLLKYRRNS